LLSFLEVGKHFASWIQDRIAPFDLAEGQDSVIADGLIFPDSGKSTAGRQLKEYFLIIDMAKELSMVERNEKGKQARRYFIECEKRMMEGATTSMGRTTSASIGADQPQRPTRHWRHPALGKDAGFWVRFLELRTQSGL
jgi:phage anti-repressor protein